MQDNQIFLLIFLLDQLIMVTTSRDGTNVYSDNITYSGMKVNKNRTTIHRRDFEMNSEGRHIGKLFKAATQWTTVWASMTSTRRCWALIQRKNMAHNAYMAHAATFVFGGTILKSNEVSTGGSLS
jgi:hypothetical protein